MIYNTAVKKDETVNESAPSLFESMLYIAESEGKMFDSLINIDFMDTLNEADEEAAPADDGAKKNTILTVIKKIAGKIWELITKAFEAVKGAFESLIKKFGEVIGTNKGLVSKYGKYVTDSKYLDAFEGIESFPEGLAKVSTIPYTSEWLSDISKIEGLFDKEASERENIIKEIDEKIANDVKLTEEKYNEAFKLSEGKHKLTADEMKECLLILSDKRLNRNVIDKFGKDRLTVLDNVRKKAKEQERQAEVKLREKADSDYAAAWKDFYAVASKLSAAITKSTNLHLHMFANEVKYARKAVIAVGHFAIGQLKGAGENEEAMTAEESAAFRDLLMFKSDVYAESVFGM